MAKFLNAKMKFEIDTAPLSPTPTYATFTKCITGAPCSGNDKLDQSTYIGDDGYGSTTVIGKQDVYSFTGHYDDADEALMEVLAMEQDLGSDRVRRFQVTYPNGDTKTGSATIANLNIGEGNAEELMGVSFEVHFNGKPTLVIAP